MNKNELKKQYAQTVQPMGVYQVINKANGKVFIDSSLGIQGKMNRCKFQLAHGSHMNKTLQEDFNQNGAANFEFEILDLLEPEKDLKKDTREDLKMLEAMWIEKIQPFDEKGYNDRKQIKL